MIRKQKNPRKRKKYLILKKSGTLIINFFNIYLQGVLATKLKVDTEFEA